MHPALLYASITMLFLSGLAVLELMSRKTHIPQPVIRKTGHVGLALCIAIGAFFFGHEVFAIVGFGFTVISLLLRQLPLKSLGAFKTTSYGEVLFPLGVGLAALIVPTTTGFIVTMLLLGLADTAAYIAGTGLKSPTLVGTKTVAGTLAFAIVAAIIVYIGTGSPWAPAVACVLAGMELVSKWGSDNLTIPLAASLLLTLLSV